MGREIKRVALDWKWPLDKVWEGYVNPHYKKCADCDGLGSTASAKALERIVSLLMIAGEDSLKRPAGFIPQGRCIETPTYPGSPHKRLYPHPYLIEAGVTDPGDNLHELTKGLAGREPSFLGHDACDRWSAARKIIAAAGLPDEWGTCKTCKGDGIAPDSKAAYDAWEKHEPPAGDGYQLWETVSEGSPISPVMPNASSLAHWLADNRVSAGPGAFLTFNQWLKFIEGPGWAMSGVHDAKGWRSGVEAAIDPA